MGVKINKADVKVFLFFFLFFLGGVPKTASQTFTLRGISELCNLAYFVLATISQWGVQQFIQNPQEDASVENILTPNLPHKHLVRVSSSHILTEPYQLSTRSSRISASITIWISVESPKVNIFLSAFSVGVGDRCVTASPAATASVISTSANTQPCHLHIATMLSLLPFSANVLVFCSFFVLFFCSSDCLNLQSTSLSVLQMNFVCYSTLPVSADNLTDNPPLV